MLEHSLLDEQLFRVTVGDTPTVTRLSLPGVLARLSAGQPLMFSALRPHQQALWHAFRVQLAYLALESREEVLPPDDEDQWADLLRSLTPDHPDDSPWHLINTDWQTPAFLQPPCSPGRQVDFKHGTDAAQDIDLLVTSRHHDEKTGKLPLDEQALDTLVYALIGLQGGSSVMGAGNYGSMRMNGGFSSRPQFRLAGPRGSGAEFLRDLTVLLDDREGLAERFRGVHGHDAAPEHRLLWLPVWDDGSLDLASIHPYALEVCRRVRLMRHDERLQLRRASSKAMRVAAKEQRGVVLDPWVPILRGDEPKALTAQTNSLGYRKLQELVFDRDKVELPVLARASEREREANQPATFIAQVLVSRNGGTDGWLSRELPMPAPVLAQWQSAPAALAQRSQLFVTLAGQAAGKVLRSALLQFVDGSDDVDWKNRDFSRAVEPWMTRFEAAIDEAFFDQLFHTIEAGHTDIAAQGLWVAWLSRTCQAHLDAAAQALPTRNGSRHMALGRAQRLLQLSLRKQFGSFMAVPAPAGNPQQTEDAAHG
ncbi:MAG: type CRISPR-associated protein Cse1/CasA [Pseudomonadota bacterium]|jgi:CRISPR system Cascade subunit CasA